MAKIFRMCLVLTVSPLPPHTRLEDKFRQGAMDLDKVAAAARAPPAGGRPRGAAGIRGITESEIRRRGF